MDGRTDQQIITNMGTHLVATLNKYYQAKFTDSPK